VVNSVISISPAAKLPIATQAVYTWPLTTASKKQAHKLNLNGTDKRGDKRDEHRILLVSHTIKAEEEEDQLTKTESSELPSFQKLFRSWELYCLGSSSVSSH